MAGLYFYGIFPLKPCWCSTPAIRSTATNIERIAVQDSGCLIARARAPYPACVSARMSLRAVRLPGGGWRKD
jgi:hypothetical protein